MVDIDIVEMKEKYGFFLPYFEREMMKSFAYDEMQSDNIYKRVSFWTVLFMAYYARSVQCVAFDDHPSFDAYVSSLLNEEPWKKRLGDLYPIFVEQYGLSTKK